MSWENGEKIWSKIDRKRGILTLIFILILLMGGFIGFCGWEISKNQGLDTLIYIIYLTAIATLSLIIVLTLFFLIIEFFIKLDYQIG